MSVSLLVFGCCQVEISAMGRSLLQSCPTDRDVPEYDLLTNEEA